ncbi:hypothetical protein DPMN_022869 [Dreissena polymorpha]|uniref:Uncharacterized protein n=1 Tax=Dreissena polymorpha TaxID=45954 RepID=A0A9D4NQY4_DREPO|nr:hypothetical protein DPMN_020496 [Dreissena polymorpha]KAH3898632.1 hypothetical protein DPMN_022869 [Dreissena polymorpha]
MASCGYHFKKGGFRRSYGARDNVVAVGDVERMDGRRGRLQTIVDGTSGRG